MKKFSLSSIVTWLSCYLLFIGQVNLAPLSLLSQLLNAGNSVNRPSYCDNHPAEESCNASVVRTPIPVNISLANNIISCNTSESISTPPLYSSSSTSTSSNNTNPAPAGNSTTPKRSCPSAECHPDLFIRVKNFGPICGTYKDDHFKDNNRVRKFLGIPFAEPPVRFASPKPKAPWTSPVLSVKSFTLGCSQWPASSSEDCLHLNIFAPSQERLKKHKNGLVPVLFWIFGGGFIFGDSLSFGMYDGSNMVHEHDVVLVTHNYRVGPFGFLVTKETRGNYGLEDQRLAMQWVRDHISQFGGDPERVTLFGYSAGGVSLAMHLISPLSQGLFSRAAVMSAPLNFHIRTRKEALKASESLTIALGCPIEGEEQLECLRKVPASQIVAKTHWHYPSISHPERALGGILVWGPNIDDHNLMHHDCFFEAVDTILKRHAQTAANDPTFRKIPLLVGSLPDETHAFMPIIQMVDLVQSSFREAFFSRTGYIESVNKIFREKAPMVLEKYPARSTAVENREMVLEMLTSYMFTCPNRKLAAKWSEAGHPTYLYTMSQAPDCIPIGHSYSVPFWNPLQSSSSSATPSSSLPAQSCSSTQSSNGKKGRVCHSSDILYVFGSTTGLLSQFMNKFLIFTEKDKYFTRFYREMLVRYAWDALDNLNDWDEIKRIGSSPLNSEAFNQPLSFRGISSRLLGRYDQHRNTNENRELLYPSSAFSGTFGAFNSVFDSLPLYNSSSQHFVNIKFPYEIGTRLEEETCNFWDSIGYVY